MTLVEDEVAALSVEPIHSTIGAIVHGVDAKKELDGETVAFVRQALLDHKVIFLRNQGLSREEQVRFAGYFGQEWLHPIAEGYPDFAWLSTESRASLRAEGWHTDATFLPDAPFGSILQLLVIPPVGGDTLWVDLEAAYSALSEPLKELVDGLVAVHDGRNFAAWAEGPSLGADRKAEVLSLSLTPTEHPLVRVHPETGRKSLYAVTGFTRSIKGLSTTESDGLLALLYNHVTASEFVVRYKWHAGDIAFWDNRNTLHRAAQDYGDAPRVLQRVTVSEFA